MSNRHKAAGRAMSMPAGLAWGTGLSLMITIVGAAVLAWMVDRELMAWEQVGYGVMLVLLAASSAGAAGAAGKIKRQRLAVCLGTGALYWLSLMAITALFFGGQYEAVGVTGLLILAGSGCVLLLGCREKRGGKRVKIRSGRG